MNTKFISRLVLFSAGAFFLYSCSSLSGSKAGQTETAAPVEAKASEPVKEAVPAPAPPVAEAAPGAPPVATPEPPATPPVEASKPASAANPAEGLEEVDYGHITLPPGPDERPFTRAEIAKILPSDAIYLSGRGVMAGKGDPAGMVGEANISGKSKHPLALEVSDLPKDQYGLVNWADALRQGKIAPKPSLNPEEQDTPPFDISFDIPTKSNFMPNVIYPHKIHTMWLTCTNCHPKIFLMDHTANNKNMTMPKIASGEFCGRCHNRVAFPLSDCLRCHVQPKEGDQYEGKMSPGWGNVSMELCGNKGIGCAPQAVAAPPK
ncbi:MAG TPA: c(7)-type cytochrome triheme domain-containing protein [Nitrospiria bacterium]|nr:c(7)-type cytochrome triheme domain-containing protein [Nitrospiria bacterium]